MERLSKKLHSALWAYRTTPRKSTGKTYSTWCMDMRQCFHWRLVKVQLGFVGTMKIMANSELDTWIWLKRWYKGFGSNGILPRNNDSGLQHDSSVAGVSYQWLGLEESLTNQRGREAWAQVGDTVQSCSEVVFKGILPGRQPQMTTQMSLNVYHLKKVIFLIFCCQFGNLGMQTTY